MCGTSEIVNRLILHCVSVLNQELPAKGRRDKVTAVIRQVAVQGKALELNVSEDEENGAGSGESSEELETPALQSIE